MLNKSTRTSQHHNFVQLHPTNTLPVPFLHTVLQDTISRHQASFSLTLVTKENTDYVPKISNGIH